ncbi:nucleoside deaminase [Halotalea alkalilenta]|uniref:tRNA-specific adenosine deaminase n=1 Tax=Halotalea alkalilenta TaxID=376489 RepID=A0A172YIW7_9GAMM|nr:nucleoside deaminase [Halotalea alkalilenta]ANF59150.1 tRNA-specific adenosine deaminase [Halotalea alkalilenta]
MSANHPTPGEVTLSPVDAEWLRHAIELSHTARQRGNRPFGAVIVSRQGEVLARAWNNTFETRDCTGHAETTAVRLASPRFSRETLGEATLYSSAEPCVMCAGAIFWANLQRVVYGIDAVSLRRFRGERLDQRDVELSCHDVFDASPGMIECIGPALIGEAAAVHEGVWQA